MTFDPFLALRTLVAHGVRFVMIGGLAGRAWGSPLITNDLDICYDRDGDNLERLAAALVALHAKVRGVDDDVPFLLDAEILARGDRFTFVTDAGDLDILGTPSGTRGYPDLAANALWMDLDGTGVLVTDLSDLIEMKLAAGRPKDRAAVEELDVLRQEIEGIPE